MLKVVLQHEHALPDTRFNHVRHVDSHVTSLILQPRRFSNTPSTHVECENR